MPYGHCAPATHFSWQSEAVSEHDSGPQDKPTQATLTPGQVNLGHGTPPIGEEHAGGVQ
ncbi:MAG TPA: hypothetical protein VK745_29550 [Polyangiaceae bacterium]|nr:hypothetical protein [Polyangiaceae bacterium]